MRHVRLAVALPALMLAASCVSGAQSSKATASISLDPAIVVHMVDERTPVQPYPRVNPSNAEGDIVNEAPQIAAFAVSATASVHATSAVLRTRFSSREASKPAPGQIVTVADAQPIVDALLKSGVPRAAITLTSKLSAPDHPGAIPGEVEIDASLKNTDPEYIRSLGKVIADSSGYPTYHAFSEVLFRDDACAPLLAKARAAALAAALAQARLAVRGPHALLGPVVSVRETQLTVTVGECAGMSHAGNTISVYRNGQFEITNGGNVVATSQLSVGFRLLSLGFSKASKAGGRAP